MSRQDRNEMNPIQRDRYERRMATRRKSMFTNIIVGGVILAVVVAIVVVAVNMLNKPKTADTGSTDATVTSATVSNPSAAATTAQQPTQAKNSNNSVQQNQQNQQNQQGQAQQQYSTDVQLPTQSYAQGTESGSNSIEEINGERVYIDTKHEAPADTGSSYHYYAYGASPEGGFNWNYDADNGNFGISCNYNFDQQQYDFSIFGVSPGTANVTLYYYDTSGQWSPVNMTVTVDDNLNVYVG